MPLPPARLGSEREEKNMLAIKVIAILTAVSTAIYAQTGSRAVNSAKIVIEGRPAVVYLSSQVTTTIRLPEPVNSVVVGDSTLFHAEHTPSEPLTVFARALSVTSSESNLVISTTRGRQFVLIVRIAGTPDDRTTSADLLVTCKAAGGFFIEDTFPDLLIAESVRLESSTASAPLGSMKATPVVAVPSLDDLMARQSQSPISRLDGEQIRVSVGQVIEQGSQLIVLFSVLGGESRTAELVAPQVQLAGRSNSGIFRRGRWTTAEQLPVQAYVMSSRRLGAGERVDGVVVFERPSLKQSTEELLLQIADSAAIDRPALAPISFRPTNSLEKDK
jgi:hypothetical protein